MTKVTTWTEDHFDTNTRKFYTAAVWSFCAVPEYGIMIIEKAGAGKKNIRVDDNAEFVYKIMKTKINAKGGAAGLFEFLTRCAEEKESIFWIETVLNRAWDDVREAKI